MAAQPHIFSHSTTATDTHGEPRVMRVDTLCPFDEQRGTITTSERSPLSALSITVQGVIHLQGSRLVSHHENEDTVNHTGVKGDGKQISLNT